jgi:alkaline phosphatase D
MIIIWEIIPQPLHFQKNETMNSSLGSVICSFLMCSLACMSASCQIKKNHHGSRTVIAFGSCSKQDIPNQRWNDILQNDPRFWIWLGDNIYGDTHDMKVMAEKYAQQKAHEGYQALLRSGTRIIGTWDDHDYGINDGGKHYSKKMESKELFLEFLDIPGTDPVHDHEGVYQSFDFDLEGKLLKVILLDTRNFRDTIYKDNTTRAYLPNHDGDVLGDAQWTWLEEELKNSEAELILLGSSIQVIPEEHRFEKWANFPAERERLLNLFRRYPSKRVIMISGDRHIAEISQLNIEALDYPLYDFTSSGLTHTWSNAGSETNVHRISDFIIDLNFGLIIIDWDDQGKHEITFQIRGEENSLLYEFKPQLF